MQRINICNRTGSPVSKWDAGACLAALWEVMDISPVIDDTHPDLRHSVDIMFCDKSGGQITLVFHLGGGAGPLPYTILDDHQIDYMDACFVLGIEYRVTPSEVAA